MVVVLALVNQLRAVLSSIGLLVGGIGVMNIMLVSVTERTQEIGIRKAVGAKRTDIVLQFLLEAPVLTAQGGVEGIIFGWLISVISRLVFESLRATVPLWAAVLGIVVSVGDGLFFGIWPAHKAARLDSVEALCYEWDRARLLAFAKLGGNAEVDLAPARLCTRECVASALQRAVRPRTTRNGARGEFMPAGEGCAD